MIHRPLIAAALALCAALAHAQPAPAPTSPSVSPAPVRDVIDTWHGTQVHDPYRYMEDLADLAVRGWITSQGGVARGVLDRIEGRAQMLARITELNNGMGDRRFGMVRTSSGALFYLLRRKDDRQVKLVMRPSLDGAEQVLVDPDVQARKTGVPHAVNYFVPSWDGHYVAYGMSAGGSEDASLYVLDVRTGQQVGEPIPRVSFGALAWTPDSRALAYNQLRALKPGDAGSETYLDSSVMLIKVGAPASSARAIFGPLATPDLGLQRLDFGRVMFAPGSPWMIAAANDTTQREGPVYVARISDLARPAIAWKRIAGFDDHLVAMELAGNSLYFSTKVNAPRFHVMKLDLRRARLDRAVVVAEPPADGLMEGFMLGRGALLAQVRQGATIGLRSYGPGETVGRPVALPFPGAARIAEDIAHSQRGFMYSLAGWSQPGRSFLLTGMDSKPLPQFDTTAPANLPELEVSDVTVRSHDGTMVPMTVIHRKGIKRDGTNPTLLIGYGSYGLSQTAGFNPSDMAWYEQGGVTAIANVRGSGVYGDPWRMAGTRLTKPNTWKDGIACAQYLIDQGYATPSTMAVMGGSAGGIFAGRSITAAPQLFAAAVIHVGLLDAIRAETTANGITNISEFGSVRDPDGLKALLEMSTYHQIKDSTAYPAVMFVHGLNDPRVDPWHSAKTAARLQAATTSGKPVLLRIDAQDGHGMGRTPAQAQSIAADQYSFMLWQMGKRKLLESAP